ncbi:unnamed protein product, partial [Mesorhabditis spiculigera]
MIDCNISDKCKGHTGEHDLNNSRGKQEKEQIGKARDKVSGTPTRSYPPSRPKLVRPGYTDKGAEDEP